MAKIVNATKSLYDTCYPEAPPGSAYILFLLVEENPVAAAGWHRSPAGPIVFSDIFDTSASKVTLAKAALEFMRTVPYGALCYAEPSSWSFLERLGWTPAGAGDPRGVWFKWLN